MSWYCALYEDLFWIYCNDKLQGTYAPLKKPYCSHCSNPGVNTESCYHKDLYGFDTIYALGAYHKNEIDLLSTHIRSFKENKEYAHPLGMALGILAKESCPEVISSDIITPVPEHIEKLYERKYNQALELCKVVQNCLNKPVIETLSKTRNIDMRSYSREQRKISVNGLYTIVENVSSTIRNKRVLLIDDVITSCFTVSECAKILKMAGASSVNVLAAGRTPLEKIVNSKVFVDLHYQIH